MRKLLCIALFLCISSLAFAVEGERGVRSPKVEAAAGATLTQEEVEDYVGGMLGGTETRITVTYDDPGGTITYVVDDLDTDTNLTQEEVEDFVGGMLDGTETGITVTYNDGAGNINFVLDDDLTGIWRIVATDNYMGPASAGVSLTTGDYNTFGGVNAGAAITDESYGTIFGAYAAENFTSGDNISVFGAYAANTLGSSGDNNIFLGAYAGNGAVDTGSLGSNIGIGWHSLNSLNAVGSGDTVFNIGIGSEAGEAITIGQYNNLIGRETGSLITEGSYNNAMGYDALVGLTTGDYNVAIGDNALSWCTGGASYNTAIGYAALYGKSLLADRVTGNNNVGVGYYAGRYIQTTSANNIFLGANSGPTAYGAISNRGYIDNAADDSPLIGMDLSGEKVGIETDFASMSKTFTVTGTAEITSELDLSGANITYVPLNGDIQTYVTNAIAGDTLVLASGVYTITSTITVNKQLNIVGQGRAGFVTAPVTPSHGTLIGSSTAAVLGFSITNDNVRIADLSLNLTGAGSAGISVANNLQGVVFNDMDIIVNSTGANSGVTIKGSDTVIRDVTFYITSSDSTAAGIYFWNDSTTTRNAVVDCWNVTGTVVGGATYAYALACLNSNDANTLELNLSNSVVKALSGTPLDVAVASTSVTTFNSTVNCYMCTLDGEEWDAYQTGTNVLNLGGSVVVNSLISGTVTYRGTMTSSSVISDTITPGGIANPTTDAEGEMAWDSNNDAMEVYDGAASRLIPSLDDVDALLFAPDGINDQIAIFHVDADLYPFGIKLVNVQITIPADAAYSMVFEEWAGDPPAAQNDIETVTTGAGDSYMEILTAGIDDSDIDADDYIFLDIPATDVDWIAVKVIFYVKEGN